MAKQIIYSDESRQAILRGVNQRVLSAGVRDWG
jgi:hypothetical protein